MPLGVEFGPNCTRSNNINLWDANYLFDANVGRFRIIFNVTLYHAIVTISKLKVIRVPSWFEIDPAVTVFQHTHISIYALKHIYYIILLPKINVIQQKIKHNGKNKIKNWI